MAITNITAKKYREPKIKKKHFDAYRSVKVWATDEERKKIRRLAKKLNLTVCDTIEFLIKEAFTAKYFKDYPMPKYEKPGEYLSTWLPPADHDKLLDIAIDWGLLIRKAAYKLMHYELDKYKDLGGDEDESTSTDKDSPLL